MERAATENKLNADNPVGSGPIITESLYDTFPRHRGTYEEPVYLPSNNGANSTFDNGIISPYSSYKPRRASPANYESVYETYQRRKTTPEYKVISDNKNNTYQITLSNKL